MNKVEECVECSIAAIPCTKCATGFYLSFMGAKCLSSCAESLNVCW